MIETHCHLDYLKARPLAETLRLCAEAGVTHIVTIGVDPENLDPVLELAEQHSPIWCTQGIHPHDSRLLNAEILEKIEQRMSHPKVVAVGEIGLDFHYNNSPREDQLRWFEAQLEVAIRTDKPVVIHSRDADAEMMEFLKRFGPRLKRKGVVHSFSSGLKLAEVALAEGFSLGFNGMITFPKAENVRAAVRLCPVDRLLIETDSPFLTPVPHRGKENAPFYLPLVLQKMAEIKQMESSVLDPLLTHNACQLFQLS
jgi:TatD DNase family protein